MKSFIKIPRFLFLILFFFTPLIFTQSNSELFELPKMYFVYLLTILIVTFHLINVFRKQISFHKKTFLDIPLILFFISQTISTVYSIDPHTSFFGYYSRLNGGLLSLICYSLLYWILTAYIDSDLKKQIINFSLFSTFLISIFAIAEHFGIDKNWWVQDVQSRVFATLGQPNWLAAYLCILIPFGIYKFLNSKTLTHKLYFFIITTCFYLSLLFTKSKSGIIACLISLTFYFIFYFFQNFKKISNKFSFITTIIIVPILFLILSLTINNPIKDIVFSPKVIPAPTDTSQSKILITSSEDIRKIVWRGAIDLWKKFPIFGTGTETFAYSYYWTRPVEHNLTSEWDYLYNKAHNEYINYLATTGLVGLVTYLFLILVVLIKIFKILKSKQSSEIKNLSLVVFCSYLSILITNFAGFSVVVTSLFFFLLPVFLINNQEIQKSKDKSSPVKRRSRFIGRGVLIIFTIIISLFLISKTTLYYLADIAYNQADSYDSRNQDQTALPFALTSYEYNQNEPLYTDKLALIYSKLALASKSQDDIDQAINYSNLTIATSPANISFWKERAQSYLYLSGVDSKYFSEAINSLLKASLLAPTDAKIPYSIGQFLETANLKQDAIPYYQKAIELKSNYDYAYFALGKIYLSQKNIPLAKENLQKAVDYSYPTNAEAENLLQKISQTNSK